MTLSHTEWSERQQIVAIILMGSLIMFGLWFFLLSPLNRRRHRLEDEIDKMRSQLARKNYLLGEEALLTKKREVTRNNANLRREWAQMTRRLAAFPSFQDVQNSPVPNIDFKVALFDVRQRLRAKSQALNIQLPHDLGMDEHIESDEDARILMLQLRTVENLADMMLDLKIGMLRDISPMPPLRHGAGANSTAYLEEFPVRVQLYGSIENIYALSQAMLEREHVFALRNLRIESASRGRPDLMSVNAVVSALVFLRTPDDLAPIEEKTTGRVVPAGH